MNKANTKIIALLLVIPLLLIFTMTSVVKTTTLAVDIPVASVEIKGDNVVDIDLAEDENAYKIETEILPQSATNKTVKLEASKVEGKEQAQVRIAADGTITALSLGSVKITAIAGGGRTDSIQINFTSSLPTEVSEEQKNLTLNRGDSLTLKEREYLSYQGVLGEMSWSSDDEDIVKVNGLGKIRGVAAGTTTVRGTINGLSVNPDSGAVNKNHPYEVSYNVTVNPTPPEQTGFEFLNCTPKDGVYIQPTMSIANRAEAIFEFKCDEEKLAAYGGLTANADEEHAEYIDEVTLQDEVVTEGGNSYTKFTLSVRLNARAKINGEYAVEIHRAGGAARSVGSTGTHIATVYVKKGYWSYAEIDSPQAAIALNKTLNLVFDTDMPDSILRDATITYHTSNHISVKVIGNSCQITANALGEAEIYAEVNSSVGTFQTEVVKIQVVDPVTSISFEELTYNLGLENVYTIAGKKVSFSSSLNPNDATTYDFYKNGTESVEPYTLHLSAKKNDNGEINKSADIDFSSSNTEIATVDANGVVTIVGDGEVTLAAKGKYNAALNDHRAQASVTLKCVKDGVWVDDYYKLTYTTEKEVPMVLSEDIMLAPILADASFNDYENYLKNYATKTMRTTADATYYEDQESLTPEQKAEAMKIRYSVSFTADVHGNGHEINAEYITNAKAKTGKSVYNGPLDLVRLIYDNTSTDNAAVKAQDNVVYLMDTAGVTISNVELKGCSDETLIDKDGENAGNANLSNLDNIGTVLEIVADDCKLLYSRVNNGRTVVRVFGSRYVEESLVKENPDAYRVQTTISNCILERGREFILKISANQIKKNPSATNPTLPSTVPESYYDDASPFFTRADGSNYGRDAIGKPNDEDDYFYTQYVMTDITLKDTVFTTAGLFCVGFESRFTGLCLHGYDYSPVYNFSKRGWGRVAGTSYPARLKMEGDVRFYDWKKVDDINSETLIEVGDKSLFAQIGLNMNVAELIRQYAAGNPSTNLIAKLEGAEYVNGAIAFYGGGKNYSYVDQSDVDSESFTRLSSYNIPLSLLGGGILKLAAGQEDFRFNLYDNQSAFTVSKQLAELQDNTAFSWVAAKR